MAFFVAQDIPCFPFPGVQVDYVFVKLSYNYEMPFDAGNKPASGGEAPNAIQQQAPPTSQTNETVQHTPSPAFPYRPGALE